MGLKWRTKLWKLFKVIENIVLLAGFFFQINIHLVIVYGICIYMETQFLKVSIKYLPVLKQSLILSMTGITALIYPLGKMQ